MILEDFWKRCENADYKDLSDFLLNLHHILSQNQDAVPGLPFFIESIIEAHTSPPVVSVDLQPFKTYVAPDAFDSDKDKLLSFIYSEASFAFEYWLDVPVKSISVSDFIDGNCTGFLIEFEHNPEMEYATWKDLLRIFKVLVSYNPNERITCHNPWQVMNTILFNPEIELNMGYPAYWAWTAAKWKMVYTSRRFSYHDFFNYKLHFSNSPTMYPNKDFGWRPLDEGNSEEIRLRIYAYCKQKLEQHLTADIANRLLEAAEIFDVAYPEAYEVGNSDAQTYEVRIGTSLWNSFYSCKKYFEDLLTHDVLFEKEWITLAQVLFQACRLDSSFDPIVTEYFLSTAITRSPQEPIHYILLENLQDRFQQDRQQSFNGKLKSSMGITYAYYAEFMYYWKKDFSEAEIYYEKFLELEPELLPYNYFMLDVYNGYRCTYPFSSQEAWTRFAMIYMQRNDLVKAKMYVQKAIELRKENWQCPYEVLAEINILENLPEEAIINYSIKCHLLEGQSLYKYKDHVYPFYYTPEYNPDNKTKYSSNVLYFNICHIDLRYIMDYYDRIVSLYLKINKKEEAKEIYRHVLSLLDKANEREDKHMFQEPIFLQKELREKIQDFMEYNS